MLNSFYGTLATAQVDGAALTNTTTATSILPAQAKATLWENYFQYIGQKLRIVAGGRISTVATPGTLTLDIRVTDPTPTTVVAFNGGAMTLNVNALTNVHWLLELELTCRAVGATANLFGQGKWTSHAVIGNAGIGTNTAGIQLLQYNTAPAVGNNFDSTKRQIVDLFATWSVANASNSIQLHHYELIGAN